MSFLMMLLGIFSPAVLIAATRNQDASSEPEAESAEALPVDNADPEPGASNAEDVDSDNVISTGNVVKSAAKQSTVLETERAADDSEGVDAVQSAVIAQIAVDDFEVTIPVAAVQENSPVDDVEITQSVITEGKIDVMEGRVTTLAAQDDVVEIRITSDPEHGNITVNPDQSLAIVMTKSDFVGTQSFTYEATYEDGTISTHVVEMNVAEGTQENGWATGEAHYMLETDADDRVIVEHGENHTKVYVSGDDNALSLADIAALEGMAVGDVTGQWLAANGDYGTTSDSALDVDAGMELWKTVTPAYSETSNWLLFERGYEYDGIDRLMQRGTEGESELHPNYITAYGTGDSPVLTEDVQMFQESSSNLVIQDIAFGGSIQVLYGENIIFDDVTFNDWAAPAPSRLHR